MKIGIVGASGYAGGELLRLIQSHPIFQASVITAHSNAGELITEVHPQLVSLSGKRFAHFEESDFQGCELIFLALPHGESSKILSALPTSSKIIDLGADFRLASADSWSRYYSGTHAGTWVYGLAELPGQRAKIKDQQRIANPGCYATSISLAIVPAAPIADLSDVVVVAASGTTGAGRSAKINLIASEVAGSLTSYKFGGLHQHTPEIEEACERATGSKVKISFTPILAPMPRGILSTISAKLLEPISTEQLHRVYSDFYAREEFVTVLPIGVMPKTSAVIGSNHTQLQVAVDSHTNRMMISVAIDNLGKGAAAAAIQNANIILGLAENTGLNFDGLGS